MDNNKCAELLQDLAYALSGYAALHPTYRAGDLVIRARAAAAELRGREKEGFGGKPFNP